jgi:glycosyltransferase involved in cell wall biosynthesis
VDPAPLTAHVREADVGLCLIDLPASLSDRLSSPNKLMEALAAGVPALCTDLVEARRQLGDTADRWILTDPATELAGALASITKTDCATFRLTWSEVKPWADEVAGLTEMVECLVGR